MTIPSSKHVLLCMLALAPAVASAQAPALVAPPPAQADAAVPSLDDVRADMAKKRFPKARAALEKYVAAHPDDAQGYLLLAQTWMALKRAKAALKPIYKVIELEPNNAEAWRLAGDINEQAKQFEEAGRVLQQAARLGRERAAALRSAKLYLKAKKPKDAVESYVLARGMGELELADLKELASAAEEAGAADAAISAYTALVKAEPKEVTHRVALARALGAKDPAAAKQQLEEILKLDPKNLDALDALAQVAEKAKDDAAAAGYLAKLCAAKPDHPTAHRRQGDVLLRLGKRDEARAAYLAQVKVGADAASEIALAQLDRDAGNLDEALAHARKATQAEAKSAAAVTLLGELLLTKGDAKGAVATLTKLGEEDAAPNDLLWAYCRALVASKQPVKAKKALGRLQSRKDVRAHEGLGELAFEAGEFKAAADHYEKVLSLHEKEADFHVRMAIAHLRGGSGKRAEALLATALKLDPKHEEAARFYGRALVEKGEFDKALPYLQTALGKYPDDAELNFALGKAQFLRNDLDKAMPALQKALATEAKHKEANELAGVIAFRRGDRQGAEKHLAIVAETTQNVEPLTALAELRFNANKIDEADGFVTRALKAAPQHAPALLVSARIRHRQGKLDDAEKAIAGYLFSAPQDRAGLLLGGTIAQGRGDLETAVNRFTAARQNAPLPAEEGVLFADALVRLSKTADALKAAQDAISAGAQTGRAHSVLAYAQYKSGDKAGARKSMEMAMSKGADDSYVHLIKGESLLEEGKRKEARAELLKVTALEPSNDRANALLGDVAMASGQLREAIKYYRVSLKANPAQNATRASLVRAMLEVGEPGDAQKELARFEPDALSKTERETLTGRIQHAMGNYKKANEHYEAALAADPKNAEALRHQGENYLKLPHFTKAIELLEKARELEPKDGETAARLAELYAETGQREKAAKAIGEADELDAKAVEERRKEIPKDQIKTVAIGTFENTAKDAKIVWIGQSLVDSLRNDLAKVATLQVVEDEQLAQIRAQIAKAAIAEDEAGVAAAQDQLTKLSTAQWMLVGSYMMTEDGAVRLNARLVDVSTRKVERTASQFGPKDEIQRLLKRVALELAGGMVDLSDEERRSIQRLADTNYESYRLAGEAKLREAAGDLRGAQALFREAIQADSGNVAALKGLDKAVKDLGARNTVAVLDFTKTGETNPEWIGLDLSETMASKLANVSGIQVVEKAQIDKIREERAWAFKDENKDLVDESTLPEIGKELNAGVILVGSVQQVGDQVQLNARLVDIASEKTLLGDRVMGPTGSYLALQEELARKLVRALVGAPSEEELAALKSKQSMDEYKAQMEELMRLRAEAKAAAEKAKADAEKQAALASAETPPETPALTEIADTGSSSSSTERRIGASLRMADGASGFAPGVHLAVAEWATKYGQLGWTITWSGDNIGGGRTIETIGPSGMDGTEAASFLIETGLKLAVKVLHLGPLAIGFGGSGDVGFQQYLAAGGGGLTLQDDNDRVLESDFLVTLRPLALAEYALTDGITLVGEAGFGIELFQAEGVPGNGLYLDLGARFDLDSGRSVSDEYTLGYRGTLLAPADQETSTQLIPEGGRGLLVHGFLLGEDEADSTDGVMYIGWARSNPLRGEGTFSYYELSYDATYRVFEERALINPTLNGRFGMAYFSGPAGPGELESQDRFGGVLGGRLGVEMPLGSLALLSAGVGYDWIYTTNDHVELSGYAVSFGGAFTF